MRQVDGAAIDVQGVGEQRPRAIAERFMDEVLLVASSFLDIWPWGQMSKILS